MMSILDLLLQRRRASDGGRDAPLVRDAAQAAAELRSLIRADLIALLAGSPPAPAALRAFKAFLDPRLAPDAPSEVGPALDDPARREALAALSLRDPTRLAAFADPASGFGSAFLLPPLLRAAFSDGAFRHDLAQIARVFLCERVLFHPGGPPQPLFSPSGLGLLLLARERAPPPGLREAVDLLLLSEEPPGFWDQWLLRLAFETSGWRADPVWRRADWAVWLRWPEEEVETKAPPLAYWRSVLDLAP